MQNLCPIRKTVNLPNSNL